MKKKYVIANGILSVAVLFSILFQLVHSYEHLSKSISKKNCHHAYTSQHEITHQHSDFEDCFLCHITTNYGIVSENFQLNLKKTILYFRGFFDSFISIPCYFKGSLFALRAPPINLK